MIQATVSTTNTVRMTLKERVIDLPTFTNYLLRIENEYGEYACVVTPTIDVARYSEFTLDLSQDDELNGAVQIDNEGDYNYYVYGQTNATNLDYTDAVVVGLIEKGTINIQGTAVSFVDVSSAVPKDVQL
jgi:hypothetical protein